MKKVVQATPTADHTHITPHLHRHQSHCDDRPLPQLVSKSSSAACLPGHTQRIQNASEACCAPPETAGQSPLPLGAPDPAWGGDEGTVKSHLPHTQHPEPHPGPHPLAGHHAAHCLCLLQSESVLECRQQVAGATPPVTPINPICSHRQTPSGQESSRRGRSGHTLWATPPQ